MQGEHGTHALLAPAAVVRLIGVLVANTEPAQGVLVVGYRGDLLYARDVPTVVFDLNSTRAPQWV